MCIYGIGLPFDHPIWQNLPPCRCGLSATPQTYLTVDTRWDNPKKPDDGCGIYHAPIPAPGGIEVRDPDDEIVAHGAFVHVERLDDDRVFLSIRTPNGQDIHIDFYAKKGRKVGMYVRDEGDTPTDIPEAQGAA